MEGIVIKIENFGDAGWLAYVDNIKGMVVQGDSPQQVLDGILTTLECKAFFDKKINPIKN